MVRLMTKKTPPTRHTGSTWQRDNDSDTVIVFVHGFLSNAQDCWRHSGTGKSWPDLVCNDEIFSNADVFLGAYYTRIDSKQLTLNDNTEELFRSLKNTLHDSSSSLLKRKNIIFLCHSYGGIVVRNLLVKKSKYFKEKNVGLLLFASPSKGSDWANRLSPLARLYGNKVAATLRSGSGMLTSLNTDFVNLINSGEIKIVGKEFSEHHFIFNYRFVPFSFTRVVDADSSGNFFPNPFLIPDTDHFDIVKPSAEDYVQHTELRNFYLEDFIGK